MFSGTRGALPPLAVHGLSVIRSILFATACLSAYAVAIVSPRAPGLSARGVDLSEYLDGAGEATRHKSLPPGAVSILARVLCGEAARQSDAEVRAIIGVVLNRAQWAPNRILDVVLKSNQDGTVWAFTALDPRRANGGLVWGANVPHTQTYRRMRRLIDEAWQAGPNHPFTNYWHPDAMKPRGAVPRWAIGYRATRIGAALFITEGRP